MTTTARPTRPHYLYVGAKTKSPPVTVCLDTETTSQDAPGGRRLALRCWAALVRVRAEDSRLAGSHALTDGTTAGGLADVVGQAAAVTGEAWVFAHNLGFDLTVTALPFVLIERGWQLRSFSLGDESCWWALEHAGCKLILTDSWSWVRCPLDDLARDVGLRKRRLPAEDDDLADWIARCRKDVEILDRAISVVIDWWADQRLGRFGITGASCGWSAMKQFVPARTLLVGPDEDRTEFERRAIFGGRKEVYKVGLQPDGWYANHDIVAAYVTAAAHYPLPARPARQRAPAGDITRDQPDLGYDLIGEVDITTRRPCAPCRIGEDVWWPVGTFRTVLTGPEIRHAATIADSIDVTYCRWYQVGYQLAAWAQWCRQLLSNPGGKHPGVIARMAKGWGRSVAGRFAGRTSRTISDRPATHLGWRLETGHDLGVGCELEVVTIGGRELTIRKDLDAADCSPAILAFIEGYCRVALARALDSTPAGQLVQCNTDGWWQVVRGRQDAHDTDGPWHPFTVTRRALERRVEVLGPNHVVTPHERRLSGVPAGADQDADGRYRFHEWPSMRWQLQHGEPGQYVQPERQVVLADNYVRRWVLGTGETIPVTATVDAGRQTTILPWSRTWGRRPGDQLAVRQVDQLAGLIDHDITPSWGELPNLPAQPGRNTTGRTEQ